MYSVQLPVDFWPIYLAPVIKLTMSEYVCCGLVGERQAHQGSHESSGTLLSPRSTIPRGDAGCHIWRQPSRAVCGYNGIPRRAAHCDDPVCPGHSTGGTSVRANTVVPDPNLRDPLRQSTLTNRRTRNLHHACRRGSRLSDRALMRLPHSTRKDTPSLAESPSIRLHDGCGVV